MVVLCPQVKAVKAAFLNHPKIKLADVAVVGVVEPPIVIDLDETQAD